MSSAAPDGDGPSPEPEADAQPLFTRADIAEAMGRIRAMHEQEQRPNEGLRERKKRITRQVISDTATWMFCERGFDQVRVAEIAADAGVSEKTVFNYFPTKESLVFDREAELVAGFRSALTERGPDESPTQAIVAFFEREQRNQLDALGPKFQPMILAFLRMIDETPALQAAHQELKAKLVAVARDALAESIGMDPHDPEPYVAAQALVALWDVQLMSHKRHIREGRPPGELRQAVLDDTRRAARLLDTGLWSFNSIAQGAGSRSQLAEAAKTANEARKQVIEALRQAKAAWRDVRQAHDAARDDADGTWWERHQAGEAAEREAREKLRDARERQREALRETGEQQREQARESREEQRDRMREAREQLREAADELRESAETRRGKR